MGAISTLGERRPYPLGPRVAQVRCCISLFLLPGSCKRPPKLLPVACPCPWVCVRHSGMPTSAGLRIFKSHYTKANPRKAGRNFQKRKKSAFNQSNDKIQSLLLSEEHRPGTRGNLHTGIYK